MSRKDIQRMIKERGLSETIMFLNSDCLSEADKESLRNDHILVGEYPCVSMLYFISNIAL